MAGGNKGSVFFAILGNGFITIIKFVAFTFSGSGALLSESIHSFADTSNQCLLLLGIRRSERPADAEYNYGYGVDRYVYALFSAMGIFVLGCGVTVYHGIEGVLHPPELSIDWLVYAVLGVSFVIEGAVLVGAIREVNRTRGDKSFREFIRSSPDPTLVAVLFEDSVACIGVLVALGGILLAKVTGNPVWDGVSSICIGLLLGLVALWLGWRNRQLILGPAIPPEIRKEIVEYLEAQPSVHRVRQVRTRVAAADRFTIAAELDYNGRYLASQQKEWVELHADQFRDDATRDALLEEFGEVLLDALGREVDRIEADLFKKYPRLRNVTLESDWLPDD